MKLFQGRKTNSFLSSSIYIFFIRFFPALVTLLVTILFSRKLDPSVYGAYQYFWTNINVLYTVACFGIHVFIITYPPDFVINLLRRIRLRQYILYAFWLILIGSVFSFLQFRAIHNRFPVPFLYLIMYVLSLILESFLIVFKKFRTLTVVNFLYACFFALLHWGVYARAYRIKQLFLYLTILMAVRLVVYFVVARRKIKEQIISPQQDRVQDATPSSVKSLWVHLGVYDIIQMLFNSIDKFIVSQFFTTRLFGIYFWGTFNIPFLALILSSVTSAVLIQLSSIKNETLQTIRLLNNSARITSCIIFPIFFFFFCYRFEFVTAIITDKYVRSIPIMAISLLTVPLKAYSFTTVLQSKHKGAIINFGAILDIFLALVLMYPLYKLMGFPGAALAFVITTYVQAGFYLYHTARLLEVSIGRLVPFANWSFKLIVFGSLFIGFHYFTRSHFSPLIGLILGVILCIILGGTALLFELRKTRLINDKALQQS